MPGNTAGAGRSDPLLAAQQYAVLDALLAGAPFGFALVDRELRFVHVNDALARMNGLPAAEHIGKRVDEISADLEAAVGGLLRGVLETGEALADKEVVGTPPGSPGEVHHWIATYYPVLDDDGEVAGVASAVMDVTDRQLATAQLEHQTAQQAAVVQLGMDALGGMTPDELVQRAITTLVDMLDVDRAAVFRRLDDDALLLQATTPFEAELVGYVATVTDRTQSGYTLTTGMPVVMTDSETEHRFRHVAVAKQHGVRSGLTVLVPGSAGPYGVLGVYDHNPRSYSDDDVRLVQSVANLVGTAVERRRTEQELVSTAQRLRLAQEVGRMGVWELRIDTGIVTWSEALEHLYGLPTGCFRGTYEHFQQLVHPSDLSRVDEAVARALKEGGYEIEHRIIRADDGETRWIVARGEVLGAEATGDARRFLGINVDITERKAIEDERADLLAAEQQARAEAEEARERLIFLAEATAVLASSLDYRQTLKELAQLATRAFADACVVDLLDQWGRLEPVAISHADPATTETIREVRRDYPPELLAAPVTDPVVREGKAVVVPAISDEDLREMAVDDRHLELLRAFRITSGILVPLVARGSVIGMISLLREEPGPAYVDDDHAFAEELARRAALAVDNARLFDAVRQTGERHRRMAETLQAALLPPHLPTVPGADVAARYRPAAQGSTVGGDFYDLFPLGEDAWGLVIGDVQGKGTEAATLTGLARHTIRTAAIQGDPVETLEVLNRVLVTDETESEDSRFCTVLYGRLATTSGGATIDFASGGHPPAVIRRADRSVHRIGGAGMLMGAFEELEVHSESVLLRPGDTVLLYTDGVLEARAEGEEFGDDRLAQVVAAAHGADAAGTVEAVLDAVVAFSDSHIRDDIALLALRVRD